MATRKPAIIAPRSGEREVAIAISNIRERIEALESGLDATDTTARGAITLATESGASAALREIESLRRRVRALELGAPMAVYVNGQLVGVRGIIDFRSSGAEVQVSGQATEDRVIVTVKVGSITVVAEPAIIVIQGASGSFGP